MIWGRGVAKNINIFFCFSGLGGTGFLSEVAAVIWEGSTSTRPCCSAFPLEVLGLAVLRQSREQRVRVDAGEARPAAPGGAEVRPDARVGRGGVFYAD